MKQAVRKLSMNQGAAYWARLTGAPRPHRGTLIRWAIKGVRGRRLRAEALAGRWYTAEPWIEEFARHVQAAALADGIDVAGPVRAVEVQSAIETLDCMIAPKRRGRAAKAK